MRPYLLSLSCAAFLYCPFYVHAGLAETEPPTAAMASGPTDPVVRGRLITLEQAWQLAENANVTLRQARAQRPAVEGEASDASSLLWNNPRLSGERVRRDVPASGGIPDRQRESTFGVEQTFEIAGQQGLRRDAAQLQLKALDATFEETRRAMRAEVERRFVQVVSLQERITTETAYLQIVEATSASIGKRVAAGEDSRLDGNLAKVEAVRARNQINVLGEQLIAARADLALVLQLPPHELPEASGTLDSPTPVYTLLQLQSRAADRPLLRALELKEQTAKSRLSLERATRYPDLTVSLSSGREGPSFGRERLTGVSLSLPLPLFRRNASGIGRANTELTLAQIERQTAPRNLTANIHALWEKMQSLNGRVQALRTDVMPALEENQRLSGKALQAGEMGLVQVLLVNRQVLEGRRDMIDAQTEVRLTRIALEEEAGWTLHPPSR